MAASTPHLAGQKIRRWRKDRGLSAEAFAELVDPADIPSPWAVYGWECHGKVPGHSRLQRLQELGVCDLGDWSKAASDGDPEAEAA